MENVFDLVVVGGGAAGFFGAIQVAERRPEARIVILEKSNKLLTKVRISGGGRCNVTHQLFNPFKLADHYPRGERSLKSLFKEFQAEDMVRWLSGKGVDTYAEHDGRMFPSTNSSQTIIDLFLREAIIKKIQIELSCGVTGMDRDGEHIVLHCDGDRTIHAKNILVATGGNPNVVFYSWIAKAGHTISPPIPSLFTFNDSERHFVDLMGVATPLAEVRIEGTKFSQKGPVLITHWGLSGPAVIKLSAWAAEYLFEKKYVFDVLVNWTGENEEQIRSVLSQRKRDHPRQRIKTSTAFSIPQRLWDKLCELSNIEDDRIWAEISNKSFNKLVESLFRCRFGIKGKTTFKEEFVTCGGVDLKQIDLATMESKIVKNVFFAGEVLNIDGETGGFNFQAAWTTAYVAAKAIAKNTAG